MSQFDAVVVIRPRSVRSAKAIIKQYEGRGIDASLYAKWSYDGSMIYVENAKEIEKLNNDKDYAHDKIVESKEIY